MQVRSGREDLLPGVVYLVGAGPGDPRLITVRGLACVRSADVLVHDRLVHPRLLGEAPPPAERIFVGKAPGRPHVTQEGIHALLVDRARAGLAVVRLKGGDPFVFGRGGEEAAALTEAGIPWEVVPGITSALGVPTGAGIPVTHRDFAASFAVVTARRCADAEGDHDWRALANVDTLVVLMGVGTLRRTIGCLLTSGRDPATPVAVIQEGTLAGEHVVVGSLASIAERVERSGIRPPAVIVIGEVAKLRSALLPHASNTTFQQPSSSPDPKQEGIPT